MRKVITSGHTLVPFTGRLQETGRLKMINPAENLPIRDKQMRIGRKL